MRAVAALTGLGGTAFLPSITPQLLAAQTINLGTIGVVLGAIASGGSIAGFLALYNARRLARKTEAETEEIRSHVETNRVDAITKMGEAQESFADMLAEQTRDFNERSTELRQQAREERARAAEAEAQRALAEAKLERERVEQAEYRHAATNALALERAERANDKRAYQDELESYRGRLRDAGLEPDRRQSGRDVSIQANHVEVNTTTPNEEEAP